MYFKICMSLGNSFRQWFLTLVRVLSRPTAHNWITGQMPVKVNVISEEIHFSGIFSFFLKHRALPFKTLLSLYPKERHLLLNLLLERSDPFAKCGGLLDQSSPDIYVRKNLFSFLSPQILMQTWDLSKNLHDRISGPKILHTKSS